jgi:hypothetical protein
MRCALNLITIQQEEEARLCCWKNAVDAAMNDAAACTTRAQEMKRI